MPSAFLLARLRAQFEESITRAVSEQTGNASPSIEWRVDTQAFGEPAPHAQDAKAPAPPTAPRTRTGGPATRSNEPAVAERFTFDSFVVGRSNRLAHDAAHRLATSPDPGFQAVFIHGDCGVGKTHLLAATARRFRAQRPTARLRWLTGEQFANEYIAAVRSGRIDAFRAAIRRLDLLCIDDVHFFAGKASTQQEFLHTFDTLANSGARVALASDGHPREIAQFSDRLVSRCLAGMVVRIDQPDEPTRLEIVRRLAGARGLVLESSVAECVAAAGASSIRDLEGLVARLEAMVRLIPGSSPAVTHALARRIISESFDPTRLRRPVRVMSIADVACRTLGVELSELLGRGRHRRVVLARSVTAYLARQLTTQSFPEIAQALNRPNHSTVVTACQRVTAQIQSAEVFVDAELQTSPEGISIADICERIKRDVLSDSAAHKPEPGPRTPAMPVPPRSPRAQRPFAGV